jgi:hypothetical protein
LNRDISLSPGSLGWSCPCFILASAISSSAQRPFHARRSQAITSGTPGKRLSVDSLESIRWRCARCWLRVTRHFAGESPPRDAAHVAWMLEEVAQMAFSTLTVNPELRPLSDVLSRKQFLRKHGPSAYYRQEKAKKKGANSKVA